MGYYLQTQHPRNKAVQLCAEYPDARIIPQPETFDEIPEELALLCVVDNGPFEAAAYCQTQRDFDDFTDPEDIRPKVWMVMNKEMVIGILNLQK